MATGCKFPFKRHEQAHKGLDPKRATDLFHIHLHLCSHNRMAGRHTGQGHTHTFVTQLQTQIPPKILTTSNVGAKNNLVRMQEKYKNSYHLPLTHINFPFGIKEDYSGTSPGKMCTLGRRSK